MKRMFVKEIKPLAALVLASALIMACGVSGNAATISPGLVATTVAMTLGAQTPLASPTAEATALPPTATLPPPTPTTPPAGLPGGVRVNFATGATSGLVDGQIQAGQVQNFILGAAASQPLMISAASLNNDVTFSVVGRNNGVVLLPASQRTTSWQTILPSTQDYLVQVYGGATTENFTLNISAPARINFDPGAISATRSGTTPGGLNVAYVLRASAGQKIHLTLDAPGGNAVLSMYGYQDGQPYLRYVTEQTSFDMTLPATQDYIIQVVPRAGAVTSYILTVKVN